MFHVLFKVSSRFFFFGVKHHDSLVMFSQNTLISQPKLLISFQNKHFLRLLVDVPSSPSSSNFPPHQVFERLKFTAVITSWHTLLYLCLPLIKEKTSAHSRTVMSNWRPKLAPHKAGESSQGTSPHSIPVLMSHQVLLISGTCWNISH